MKTKEELNEIKKELECLYEKLSALSEEELTEVCGGLAPGRRYWPYMTGNAEQGKENL